MQTLIIPTLALTLTCTRTLTPQTPGTLLCLAKEHESRTTPLSVAEIKQLHMGELRKLHPTEQLASFSFEPHEYPQFKGGLNEQCVPTPA